MEIVNGLLSVAEQHATLNQDDRPSVDPDLIVVHCISLPAGHFGGDFVRQLFCNQLDHACHSDFSSLRGMHVSSHLFIRRDGQILQFVPFNKRAWHAGKSVFQEREACNDFSIGIELEGTDISAFNDVQYEKLALIVQLLIDDLSIPANNVVGHSDIAPGRKTDPGIGFDWPRLRKLVNRQ